MGCKSCEKELEATMPALIDAIKDGLIFPDAAAYAGFNDLDEAYGKLTQYLTLKDQKEVILLIKWKDD